MAQSTTMRLRGLWLQIHKWIGLSLAILIIPISLTGSALVWHDWLDETLNPQRYAVDAARPRLRPRAYAAAARRRARRPASGSPRSAIPSRRGAGRRSPRRGRRSRARPGRRGPTSGSIPATGECSTAPRAMPALVRVLHVLHGSLMVPGWGRTIVGWVGVFMFVSCLTGIWLWWPVTGSVRRGFRWKRQNSTNANLHHLIGFWILLPLAMLSFTGFWISFPSVFSQFEATQPKAKGKAGGRPTAARAMRARPLDATAMTRRRRAGRRPAARDRRRSSRSTWPTDQSPRMEDRLRPRGRPGRGRGRRCDGEVTPPRPPRPETRARLMRRCTTAPAWGSVWQIVIFIGGIIPALLAITGIVMWLRSRGWRGEAGEEAQGQTGAAAGGDRPASRVEPALTLCGDMSRGRRPSSRPRPISALAGGQSRDRAGAARRLLEEGQRQALDRLAAGARPGALLRLDRRRPQVARRRELHDPLHAAAQGQHLEQGQCRPLRGADAPPGR